MAKSSQLLKKARVLLENDKERYVCRALDTVLRSNIVYFLINRKKVKNIQTYIQQWLYPWGTYAGFLLAHPTCKHSTLDMKYERMLWIDRLVDHYESQGD